MIPFVDLKSQYLALKSDIDHRIHKVLDHGAYINGPEIAEFENLLSEFTGSPYVLTCASGTDALLMPLMALNIGPGDEVITTAFSFIATAETIVLSGATPVYVDIDPVSFNIDPQQVKKALTKKTKAIMPVSLYGNPCDMNELNLIAKTHGISVIEDAAQSFGAFYHDKRSCNLSSIAGTSFFPAKPLGCYGDGGAVFTTDQNLYKIMKEIREHGSETRYYHTRLGINGRLDTIQCAILISKLSRYNWEMEQRQKIADRFNTAFSEVKMDGFSIPRVSKTVKSAWAQYTLMVPQREKFQKSMTELGVPTSIHYPRIMPEQPWYQKQLQGPQPDWKNSKHAAQHVISLPIYPDMNLETQDKIIAAVFKSIK